MSTDLPPDLPSLLPSYRGSGVLLHVTSIPSAHGIGDLGPTAMAWMNLTSVTK